MKKAQKKRESRDSSQIVPSSKLPEKRLEFIADNFSEGFELNEFFKNVPPDLSVWASLYIKLQVEKVKADKTVQANRSDLQKFIQFFQQHHRGLDVRAWLPRTTSRYLEHLEGLGQKPKTIGRALVTLRSFAKWLVSVRPGLLQMGNPTKGIRPPTQEAAQPKGLNERQVKRVLDAAYHMIAQTYPDEELLASNERWYQKGHRQMRRPFRDYAILMLMLNAGLRRAEICDLDKDQFKGRHLRGVKCKGNLYRDVLLGEETIKTLEAYLEQERPKDSEAFSDSPALFLPTASRKHRNATGRLSPRTVNVIVQKFEKAANQGLPSEEQFKLHPHVFRHTHAYQILRKGRSLAYVQRRLGHQSMNYLSLYTQMPEEEEKELLDEAEFK